MIAFLTYLAVIEHSHDIIHKELGKLLGFTAKVTKVEMLELT